MLKEPIVGLFTLHVKGSNSNIFIIVGQYKFLFVFSERLGFKTN